MDLKTIEKAGERLNFVSKKFKKTLYFSHKKLHKNYFIQSSIAKNSDYSSIFLWNKQKNNI